MAEWDMQSIRDRLDRQEELLREERQVLSRDYKLQGMLFDALELSARASKWGLIPSIAWLFYVAHNAPTFVGLGVLFLGAIATVLVHFGGYYASSLVTFYWFRETKIPVPRTAVILTLLVDAAYLGWLIVLTSSG